MKQFVVILLLVSGSLVHVHAQSFLENLKKKEQGGGTVTVIQSAGIDELVNNAKLNKAPNAPAAKPAEGKETAAKPVVGAQGTAESVPGYTVPREQPGGMFLPHSRQGRGSLIMRPTAKA